MVGLNQIPHSHCHLIAKTLLSSLLNSGIDLIKSWEINRLIISSLNGYKFLSLENGYHLILYYSPAEISSEHKISRESGLQFHGKIYGDFSVSCNSWFMFVLLFQLCWKWYLLLHLRFMIILHSMLILCQKICSLLRTPRLSYPDIWTKFPYHSIAKTPLSSLLQLDWTPFDHICWFSGYWVELKTLRLVELRATQSS